MAGKVHWDSHESSLLALLSFGEVCCYACILFRASGHPFQAEGTCGFWMLPRAWGHAEPMWGWEARWGWWGGWSSTQRGWDQPALCWAVLGHTGLAGSLLQKGFLQGLLAWWRAGVFNNTSVCSYQLIAG